VCPEQSVSSNRKKQRCLCPENVRQGGREKKERREKKGRGNADTAEIDPSLLKERSRSLERNSLQMLEKKRVLFDYPARLAPSFSPSKKGESSPPPRGCVNAGGGEGKEGGKRKGACDASTIILESKRCRSMDWKKKKKKEKRKKKKGGEVRTQRAPLRLACATTLGSNSPATQIIRLTNRGERGKRKKKKKKKDCRAIA